MGDFGENIPLSFHVINVILLYNRIFSHHFHRKDPITLIIMTITAIISSFFPHLKHFTERALSHKSHNLKIPLPNLSLAFSFQLGVVFAFKFLDLERKGGGREGVARGGAHEGVGTVANHLRVT